MLTLFTTCRPFQDIRTTAIQRNALTSWTLLDPRPEILVFGDELGVAEVCRELGLRHVEDVARSASGIPLVGDLFRQAQLKAKHDLLCYVNADIILLSDFIAALRQVAGWRSKWLLIGARQDVDLAEAWDFSDQDWPKRLLERARRAARSVDLGSDYFAFPRGLYPNVPDFAVGRTAWDNWLMWWPHKAGSPVVDGSRAISAIHQGINSLEVVRATAASLDGQRNLRLAGTWGASFIPADANFELSSAGVRSRRRAAMLNRIRVTLTLLRWSLGFRLGSLGGRLRRLR
jgi:hypothetical protein